jgi:hypothetical protein
MLAESERRIISFEQTVTETGKGQKLREGLKRSEGDSPATKSFRRCCNPSNL